MSKTFVLMKTLLVTAGLAMGANAWAQYLLSGDTETYNFNEARNTSDNTVCINLGAGAVTVNETACDLLGNIRLEMNDRFAAETRSSWMIHKDDGKGLYNGNSNALKLGILKLSAGDVVTLTFTGSITFSGTPNVTNDGASDGSELASGTAYTIGSDGMLALSVASGASISQLTIKTSNPVLDPPTLSCEMTLSDGKYNPSLTVSSPVADVTYNVSLGGVESTSTAATYTHTFTSANTLTIYTSKDGRTNSAKRTLTVTDKQVGMILANTVATTSLDASTINYETGATPTVGQGINGTWAIPGLNFEGGFVFRTNANRIKQEKGTYRLTCSVLNDNRVAILKHNYYQLSDATVYDFLTNANDKNYAVFRKTGSGGTMKSDVFFQYDLYVHPDETVTATVGATGYSTFSSPVPLDFSGVSGLKAYVATSTDGSNVTLTRVMTAPANTGLVLKGTANQNYTVPVTASVEAPESNLLVGCIVETKVAKDATSKFNNFVLVNNSGTAEFQSLATNGATVIAGKAFLKNGSYSSGARALQMVFDDETTGIEDSVKSEEIKVKSFFNLSGQRVSQPTKGLYLVNGKKVVIK